MVILDFYFGFNFLTLNEKSIQITQQYINGIVHEVRSVRMVLFGSQLLILCAFLSGDVIFTIVTEVVISSQSVQLVDAISLDASDVAAGWWFMM